ncbi:ABC transporter ATP-binding protein [Luteimonas lutimaris]|uniref:ABC transporter ATP-binding protein n=1 Tax=Luteimonas lutimaris TaxID=698645 RepID=A0ABP7MWQ6_9GAMM
MTVKIQAKGMSLKVPNYVQRAPTASGIMREILSEAFVRSRREYRTILDGLDFTVDDGDRIALLGRNGAGKTTLLRVLSGAFQPTEGMLEVQGTRQALLNLSLGFNNNASVRENIFLRGTAMGMKLSKMAELVDSILEFADLAEVARHRLLTLSSGQRMRLGFAISTSVQHDIMLMDEWFGAGDASFIAKARTRLSDRVDGCRIMVLASHNLQMIRKTCSRGLVLDGGRQVFIGPVEEAIDAYKAIYQSLPGYVPRYDKKIARAKKRAAARRKAARPE